MNRDDCQIGTSWDITDYSETYAMVWTYAMIWTTLIMKRIYEYCGVVCSPGADMPPSAKRTNYSRRA